MEPQQEEEKQESLTDDQPEETEEKDDQLSLKHQKTKTHSLPTNIEKYSKENPANQEDQKINTEQTLRI
jgi:hypothetical protein